MTPTTQKLEILKESHYYPYGMEQDNPRFAKRDGKYKYKYNAKEYQDELGLDWYDYGARSYDASLGRWMNVDPLAEEFLGWSPYNFVMNNPINMIDPDGRAAEPPSTGVRENDDGTYTVVDAKNDGNTGIYIVDDNGCYDINTSEKIGDTLNSWDFMLTDDSTGKFTVAAEGVRFNPESNLNFFTLGYKHNYKGSGFSVLTDLAELAILSRNNGPLDIKEKYGRYTTVVVNSKEKIYTTVRYTSNVNFGKNMRNMYDNHYKNSKNYRPVNFYMDIMPFVGEYNQYQNGGNGYNSGYPFYGEHTYSGTGIYNGFYSRFNYSKFINP